jgi:hypothetical protein
MPEEGPHQTGPATDLRQLSSHRSSSFNLSLLSGGDASTGHHFQEVTGSIALAGRLNLRFLAFKLFFHHAEKSRCWYPDYRKETQRAQGEGSWRYNE